MADPRYQGLTCPLDGDPLTQLDGRLVCPAGHSFDIARQGYVNLLPVQHKKSRAPGDSAAMVKARTAFLDAGVYARVADAVVDKALAMLAGKGAPVVLDAGCGDGYYLDGLQRALCTGDGECGARLVGLDIAKPAILAASRRNQRVTWLVGSNVRPPLAPASVDLVLCLFGFPAWPAFAEVLRPGGQVLLLDAGPDHLVELRQIIYPEVRRSPPQNLDKAAEAGFALAGVDTLTFRTGALASPLIEQLLVMTPHLYRASRDGKAAAAALTSLDITVDVVLRTLRLATVPDADP